MPQCRQVSVVIAARNAEDSIGRAVLSALEQTEVAEVIVVDDASTDETGTAAHDVAPGDPRLDVIRTERNIGPAAARNLAIGRSSAPFIALLDADDCFLPGRLGHLLDLPDWDMAADNITFFSGAIPSLPRGSDRIETLDLVRFVEGNFSRKGENRGELGFLKPVLRREFLHRHGLGYDEHLRLGEDYDLYVRCLQRGARFVLTHRVGYLAEVRETSLSSHHTTSELSALVAATDRHIETAATAEARYAMRAHRRQLVNRYLLRAFLDRKSAGGVMAALAFALRPPSRLAPIAMGVLADKLRGSSNGGSRVRTTLLPVSDASGA